MAKKRPNVDGANGQKATADEMFIRQLVNELPFVRVLRAHAHGRDTEAHGRARLPLCHGACSAIRPQAPPVFNEETQALPIPVHADSIAYEPGWRIRSAPSKPLTAPLSADGALGGPWHRPKDRAAQMTYLPLPSAFDFNSPTGFAAGDGVMLAFAPPQTVVSRPRIGAAAPQTLAVPVPLGRNRSASGSTSGSAASVHSELSRRPSWEQEETTIALAVPAPTNDEAVGRKKTLKERLLGRS